MNVSEAIASRYSTRAFLDRPVSRQTIVSILDRARRAPSGGNLQPWLVYVLTGSVLEDFKALVQSRRELFPKGEGGEYPVYPPNLKEPYRSRRYKCGEDLYASVQIPREDKTARLAQYAKNLEFFGAPVAMFFALDRIMGPNQWAHLGMFMQNIMLLAREEGLHTCAQEVWGRWHKTVGEFLELPDELMLYCGMAIGYADESAAINRWRTDRVPVEEFTQFRGFEES